MKAFMLNKREKMTSSVKTADPLPQHPNARQHHQRQMPFCEDWNRFVWLAAIKHCQGGRKTSARNKRSCACFLASSFDIRYYRSAGLIDCYLTPSTSWVALRPLHGCKVRVGRVVQRLRSEHSNLSTWAVYSNIKPSVCRSYSCTWKLQCLWSVKGAQCLDQTKLAAL